MLFEPLLLMWMLTKGGQTFGTPGQSSPGPSSTPGKPSKRPKKAPKWPTTRSPPPPMPAFTPNPPMPAAPPAPDANTGTPLATLARQRRPAPKPRATPVQQATRAATRAATSTAKSVLNRGASSLFSSFGFGRSSEPMQVKGVLDLQKVLNTWGGTLALDGKYGPKTAAAWQSMAKRNNLPTTIARNGPTTAKVAVRTWEALNVPNIP